MLSFLTKIKNNINDKLKNRHIVKRKRPDEAVIGSVIKMTNPEDSGSGGIGSGSDSGSDDERTPPPLPPLSPSPSPPPPPPVVTRTLFRTEIDEELIKKDYELQELIRIMNRYKFNIKDHLLEPRYEATIRNIPGLSDIVKIKLRILYIIIANNIYRDIFDEKKQYKSVKTKHELGVFRYNGYIIRIDDSPYSFISEMEVINATRVIPGPTPGPDTRIIRPFLVYSNIKRNLKHDICDCRFPMCDCKYYDCVDSYDGMDQLANEPRTYYNKLRENMISFSIQHYVKETQTLYNWVKDNYLFKPYVSSHNPFFIHLFYQCAKLLRDIHKLSIVHGDIKPDNILIREHDNFDINHPDNCKEFTVYLIDFGLSGVAGKSSGTGGTIPYCHPEFNNIRDTNRTSKYHWKTLQVKHDVWSLGIAFLTLYIYRDFYNYYYKYPNYVFMSNGYISSLILDVISNPQMNVLFTKILSVDCIPIEQVCDSLRGML
jgi:hypothetical protein